MQRSLVAGLLVLWLPSLFGIHAADPKDSLQSSWTLVSTEQGGKVKSALADPFTLLVSGTTVRLRHGKDLIWEATIKRQPADEGGLVKFDLVYNRTKGVAPPPKEDGSAYGILQIRGDEMKFTVSPGSDDRERPKDFATTGKNGAERRVFTWHRTEKTTVPEPPLGIKIR